jgi:hypothetical protein
MDFRSMFRVKTAGQIERERRETQRRAWSRRSFMTAVGAGAASLPFFKLLENSAAQAEPIPLCFVGIYMPHGVARELWAPGDGFDLTYENCSLSPFDDAATYGTSFKDKIATVSGIDLVGAMADGTTGHDASRGILTNEGKNGTSPSIDQFLAIDQGLGADSRFASLVLGVGDDTPDLGHSISYGAGGVALPKIIDPVATFNMVFADLVAGQDPEQAEKIAQQRRKGQSVIDFVRGDIGRLNGRLAKPEQEKLEQHLNALRELEKRLEDFAGSCVLPAAPDPATFPLLKAYNGGEPYFDTITELQFDLLAQAMACGLTRFGTMWLNDLSRTTYDPSLPDDIHNSVAHMYSMSYQTADQPSPGDPATWLPLAKQNKYIYAKIARFMQKLTEFGVLDSTLIYATSDMGDPAMHSSTNVPTLLAGGGGLKLGQHIDLGPDCPDNKRWCSGQEVRTSNARVLTTIMQAFGVEADTYGVNDAESGGLPGLT